VNTITVIILLAFAALSFGCGKSEKTYQTPGGEVKVKQSDGEVVYQATAKDGQKVTVAAGETGIALPAGFPKDVPLLDGASVKVAMTQGKQMLVHLSAPGSVADAAKFYDGALKQQGWEIDSTVNAADVSMISAKKGKRQCSVSATRDGDGVLVQLAVSDDDA